MNATGTIVNDTARFERDLPGPIERVWSYLTERERLTTWLAEDGAVPPRPGESFTLRMAGGDDMPEREGQEATIYGTVRTYDPPNVLEYIWGNRDAAGNQIDSIVRFELTAHADRVHLVLTHHPILPGFESRTLAGWHALLDALQSRLTGTEPPPGVEAFRALEQRYARTLNAG